MLALGVDIGGTQVRAAVVDRASGQLLVSAKELTGDRSPAAIAGMVTSLVERIGHGHPVGGAPVGVGLAAMISGSTVVNAPNLGWRDEDFGGLLERRLGRRVCLVNDLSAAAWGELKAGAARGGHDTFTVFVGTGVGAAIITGGRLVLGANGVAGELGHIKVVTEGGRSCGCGQHGCLEAYAGGANLSTWMQEIGIEGTPTDLENKALAGEPDAKTLYDFVAGHLALAIANQVTVLNPEILVLGGGVLMHCPGLVKRITDAVHSHASVVARRGVRVQMAELGDDSGIVGAALLGASG